jgi:hypothetical protein
MTTIADPALMMNEKDYQFAQWRYLVPSLDIHTPRHLLTLML